jgi:hypothetical protein
MVRAALDARADGRLISDGPAGSGTDAGIVARGGAVRGIAGSVQKLAFLLAGRTLLRRGRRVKGVPAFAAFPGGLLGHDCLLSFRQGLLIRNYY